MLRIETADLIHMLLARSDITSGPGIKNNVFDNIATVEPKVNNNKCINKSACVPVVCQYTHVANRNCRFTPHVDR